MKFLRRFYFPLAINSAPAPCRYRDLLRIAFAACLIGQHAMRLPYDDKMKFTAASAVSVSVDAALTADGNKMISPLEPVLILDA